MKRNLYLKGWIKMNWREKFFRGVVNHKKLVIILFLVSTIIFSFCNQFIEVNYDINSYLPNDSASTISLNLMKEEFDSKIPNARVMVSDVTIPQALEIKSKLQKIDGITEVSWLDDEQDPATPLETIEEETIQNYYKEGNALFSVTIDNDKNIEAVKEIRQLIGKENAMTGSAVNTATATQATSTEIGKIVMLAVPFTLFILLITTVSWFEAFLVLGTIGIAIIINSGSNIIFGEISFVTNAAGSILQLAVSLDYSVFLIHRFKEMREKGLEPQEAMVQALCKSTMSILSSGLTTVIGFLALTLMQFQIGPDLGFALAKGIAISLITVFVLTPVLTLYFYKLIDKTTHRDFMPKFQRLGGLISKIMIPMVIIFMIIIIPSYIASGKCDYYYGSSKIFGSETKLGQDTEKIEEVFGKSNNFVVMVPVGNLAKEKEMSDALKEIPQVSSIISYVDKAGTEIPTEYLDEQTLELLISDHYSRMILSVKTNYEGEEAFQVVEEIRQVVANYYPNENYVAGESVSTYDLMDTVTADMVKVNFIAIAAVFVVLLISLKSITLPFILVLAIETAVWFNLSLPYYIDTPLFYIAYLIISSVQLGATVDYAILLTDRYVEFRKKYYKKDAVKKTISAVTVSILTSGTVMTFLGFLLGGMTSHGVLSQLGYLLGKGTICSLVIVLFVLPGLLYLFDKPIRLTTKGSKFVNKNDSAPILIELQEVE